MSKKFLKNLLLCLGAFLTLGILVANKLIKIPFGIVLGLLLLGMSLVIYAAYFLKGDKDE